MAVFSLVLDYCFEFVSWTKPEQSPQEALEEVDVEFLHEGNEQHAGAYVVGTQAAHGHVRGHMPQVRVFLFRRHTCAAVVAVLL